MENETSAKSIFWNTSQSLVEGIEYEEFYQSLHAAASSFLAFLLVPLPPRFYHSLPVSWSWPSGKSLLLDYPWSSLAILVVKTGKAPTKPAICFCNLNIGLHHGNPLLDNSLVSVCWDFCLSFSYASNKACACFSSPATSFICQDRSPKPPSF